MVLSLAQDAVKLPLAQGEDLLRIWWNVAAMLVLLMQLGFICLEMGCVREHNRVGIAVKNFMMLIASVLFFSMVGFYLMFGSNGGQFFGWGWGPPEFVGGNPYGSVKIEDAYGWLFYQTGFAAVAATIMSGALAGRTTLISNVLVAMVMVLIVYPIFGHWVWAGNGWLYGIVHDFAGSGVVHFVGGTAALIGIWVAGPRRGWDHKVGLKPSSLPFATVGVVLLWIGWIGFNGGSLTFSDTEGTSGFGIIGMAVLATSVAACAGAFAAAAIAAYGRFQFGPGKGLSLAECFRQRLLFDPFATLSGAMGGMVAITANCDWLQRNYHVAIYIGAFGGLAAFATAILVRRVLKLDDPVEAVAVHAGGGAAGMLCAAFAPGYSLTGQLLGLCSAAALTMAVMFPVFMLLKRLGILRCSIEEEQIGLTFEPAQAPMRAAKLAQRGKRTETSNDPR